MREGKEGMREGKRRGERREGGGVEERDILKDKAWGGAQKMKKAISVLVYFLRKTINGRYSSSPTVQ